MYVKRTLLFAVILGSAAAADTIIFQNVNVVSMDREIVMRDQNVVVEDGRIVRISPASEFDALPSGAIVIEGDGKYLMPGLAEMHGHLPSAGSGLPARWRDDLLFLYVANGVTTVRGMLGNTSHLALRDAINRGEVLGPKLYVASPPMNGRSVQSPEQAERLVREYKAAGFDLLKILEGLQPAVYDAIARTAKEVGIDFGGHVPDAVGLWNALDAGQITIDHMDNMFEAVQGDRERLSDIVRRTKEAGASVVPTEALWEHVFLSSKPAAEMNAIFTEIQYMPEAIRSRWAQFVDRSSRGAQGTDQQRIDFRRALLKELSDGGVRILLGTDSPQFYSVPGFSIHRELKVMRESGMSPYEILDSGTRRVAEYFGEEDEVGTVAEGKRADLILLNANPLKDVANVANRAGVMVNGRWLPETQLQARLAEIATAYR